MSFLTGSASLPSLHSFPTRRSSDLSPSRRRRQSRNTSITRCPSRVHRRILPQLPAPPGYRSLWEDTDRKSTRLNSSHVEISYAVFCLKKKNNHFNLQPVANPHQHFH